MPRSALMPHGQTPQRRLNASAPTAGRRIHFSSLTSHHASLESMASCLPGASPVIQDVFGDCIYKCVTFFSYNASETSSCERVPLAAAPPLAAAARRPARPGHVECPLSSHPPTPLPLAAPCCCCCSCCCSARDLVGFCCGLASIACWMVAQMPQLYRNYRTQSADALSPWFLAEWLLVSGGRSGW